ncbi:MAG: hypothetical protein MZV64_15375 [Ignavibacteriales bacterium]|nr:hypothetical protein [Ignavibacteriales bacterium]
MAQDLVDLLDRHRLAPVRDLHDGPDAQPLAGHAVDAEVASPATPPGARSMPDRRHARNARGTASG